MSFDRLDAIVKARKPGYTDHLTGELAELMMGVVKAAEKISGHTPYCIAEKVMADDTRCRCGSRTLLKRLEALHKAVSEIK